MTSLGVYDSGRVGLRHRTRTCNYGKNAKIKVSSTNSNLGRLFYYCKDRKCNSIIWYDPINIDESEANVQYKQD